MSTAVNSIPTAVPEGLVYTTDAKPGIARLRRGKGFAYRRADGRPVKDERELARIRRLAIPPAYREVWICPRPNGHLQATGLDARGRKQYRYHEAWREGRDQEKFERLVDFAGRLPRIRRHVSQALAQSKHDRPLLLAAVVRMLDTTLGRIGNDQYARENGSYGLTTLCDHHVRVVGDRIELTFKGKSGIEHHLRVRDARVARVLRRCLSLPGESLFRHVDDEGAPHCVGSAEVNDYLKQIAGAEVSAKDFRTWHASVLAFATIVRALDSDKERFTLKRMLAHVSQALGNTPAVCRRSYVHPAVIDLAIRAARDPEDARSEIAALGTWPQRAGLRLAERGLLAYLRAPSAVRTRRRAPTEQGGTRARV